MVAETKTHRVVVQPDGSVTIPSEVLERAGIKSGDEVYFWSFGQGNLRAVLIPNPFTARARAVCHSRTAHSLVRSRAMRPANLARARIDRDDVSVGGLNDHVRANRLSEARQSVRDRRSVLREPASAVRRSEAADPPSISPSRRLPDDDDVLAGGRRPWSIQPIAEQIVLVLVAEQPVVRASRRPAAHRMPARCEHRPWHRPAGSPPTGRRPAR